MGKQLVLCILLVVVLVALYMLVRRCDGKQDKKRRHRRKYGVGPVNPNARSNVQIDHRNPCDYLAINGYDPSVVQLCNQYGKICGTPSVFDYAVSVSESFETFDKEGAINAMKSDLALVTSHHNMCMAPSVCTTDSDCQPAGTDFGMSCKNIVCVQDDCKPEEECTPSQICTGSCL